jgi:membrane associated rhomboid family serine protease
MVSLSTRTIGAMADQLWMTRVSVAALAGDSDELERLMNDPDRPQGRGLAGFVAAWRGRCARQRGDREEAGRQLSRALALLPAGQSTSRERLTGYLENMDVPVTVPDESVRAGFAMLRGAEKQMLPWRNLMNWSRPASVTAGLLVLLCAIHFWNIAWVHTHWHDDLSVWAGNLPWRNMNGQWWRPLTAVFLHGGWLHLALNSVALWMFGTAIEKSQGWVRMLMIFVVAGTAANVASAYVGGFDVSVGASGGINGLIAAFGVTVYRLKAPIHPSLRKRLLVVLGLMLAADMVIGSLEPMIDNTAHIAGLVVGFLLALVP